MNEIDINKFQHDIIKLLNDDLILEKINYNLIGIILMPPKNHFNEYLKINQIYLNWKKNWYFHFS